MATGLVPAQRVLPLFDPVLNIAASVVHLDHLPGRQLGIGHDGPDPREEYPIVPFDLRDNSAFSVQRLCPMPEINQPDLNSTLERSPQRARQTRVDESFQYRIGRKPDEVRGPFTLAILIDLGLSKCRITTKPEEDGATWKRVIIEVLGHNLSEALAHWDWLLPFLSLHS